MEANANVTKAVAKQRGKKKANSVSDELKTAAEPTFDNNHKLRLLTICANPENHLEVVFTKNLTQDQMHLNTIAVLWDKAMKLFNDTELVLECLDDVLPYPNFDLNAFSPRSVKTLKEKWTSFKTETEAVLDAYHNQTGVPSADILLRCVRYTNGKKFELHHLKYAFTHYCEILSSVSKSLDGNTGQERGLGHFLLPSVQPANQEQQTIGRRSADNLLGFRSPIMSPMMDSSFCDDADNGMMSSSSSSFLPIANMPPCIIPIKVEGKNAAMSKADKKQGRTENVADIKLLLESSSKDNHAMLERMTTATESIARSFERRVEKRKIVETITIQEEEDGDELVLLPYFNQEGVQVGSFIAKKRNIEFR